MMQDDFYTPQIYFDQVHEGIVLPQDICDHLLQTMVQEGLDIDDRVSKAFGDTSRSRLRHLELRNANITNAGFSILSKHNLRVLKLQNCHHLTDDILTDLNNHSCDLVDLCIDSASGVMPAYLPGPR